MSSLYPPFGGATARPCIRCGAPLSPNELQCSRCGMYNPYPQQGSQPGTFQQGSNSGGAWGAQVAQVPQTPQNGNATWNGSMGSAPGWGATSGQAGGWSQNNLFAGSQPLPPSPSSPSQPLQQNLFSSPDTNSFAGQSPSGPNNTFNSFSPNTNQLFPHSSFSSFQQNPGQSLHAQNFFNAAQQNAYGTTPFGQRGLNQQQNWQEEEDDDEGKIPNVFMIVGIVALVLLLIGGGVFGAIYFLGNRNNTANVNNKPKIVTPSVTPLFQDTFKNNNNGWDLTNPSGASIKLANNGKLVMESDNNKLFQELVPGKTFGDLRVDVDADLTAGVQANGYGVYIRGASTQDDPLGINYRFEVYGDGTFAVYKGVQNTDGTTQSNNVKTKTVHKAILYAGQANHLTIIAKGAEMTFQVNGETIYTFSDKSYKSGSVALFVSNVSGVKAGAQATFQNLAIFPAS